MSLYVISYDIAKDKTRTKVAKLLENYGVRMQYSVFECDLDDKRFNELFSEIKKMDINANIDSIRFYKLCKNCEKGIKTIGTVEQKRFVLNEKTIVI